MEQRVGRNCRESGGLSRDWGTCASPGDTAKDIRVRMGMGSISNVIHLPGVHDGRAGADTLDSYPHVRCSLRP